jgi:hypothetical protein
MMVYHVDPDLRIFNKNVVNIDNEKFVHNFVKSLSKTFFFRIVQETYY